MKIGKVLRYTAMASAIAVLAFAAKGAYAGNGGDGTNTLVDGVFQGHVGASVVTTTAMVEHDPVSFGNIAAPTAGGTLVMDATGARTGGTGITPLSGGFGTAPDAADTLYGAAKPGSYSITGGSPNSKIYITYLAPTGTATTAGISGSNPITLTGPAGNTNTGVLTVTALTDDTGHVVTSADNDIYAGDAYSSKTLDGTGAANFKVGGTLSATAGTYQDGPYRGVFDIMVHY